MWGEVDHFDLAFGRGRGRGRGSATVTVGLALACWLMRRSSVELIRVCAHGMYGVLEVWIMDSNSIADFRVRRKERDLVDTSRVWGCCFNGFEEALQHAIFYETKVFWFIECAFGESRGCQFRVIHLWYFRDAVCSIILLSFPFSLPVVLNTVYSLRCRTEVNHQSSDWMLLMNIMIGDTFLLVFIILGSACYYS